MSNQTPGMPSEQPSLAISNSRSSRLNLSSCLLRRLLSAMGDPPVTAALWDATEIEPPYGASIARVYIRDRRTLWKLCLNPEFEFGEAYCRGDIQVEGDLPRLLDSVFARLFAKGSRGTAVRRRLRLPRRSTLSGARRNIYHHYDIGNDFYRLWLDDQMVYTCAYFSQPEVSLEQAQIDKMDHVCRKLRLQPGETVLEPGCGWGALALHMARHYGVRVKAFNISREQISYARERARREHLEDCVEFIEDDWRNMHELCDVFVSVGMLEHIGVSNYGQLSDVMDRCLKQRGRGLIHSIGQNYPQPLNAWIQRRIFPGAYPPALREMMALFEPHDFSVLDVENLRLHYAQTLRCWLERFEQSTQEVHRMFDERFLRMWKLYLSGSIAGFESGGLQLFQIVFARGSNNRIPRTRAHLYSAESNGSERPHDQGRCQI